MKTSCNYSKTINESTVKAGIKHRQTGGYGPPPPFAPVFSMPFKNIYFYGNFIATHFLDQHHSKKIHFFRDKIHLEYVSFDTISISIFSESITGSY